MKKYLIPQASILFLILVWLVIDRQYCINYTCKGLKDTVYVVQESKFVLNEQSIYDELIRLDIKHPKIVLRQSIIETNHYKSDICKKYNNIFGFRTKDYLKFNSYLDCIKYYAKWQKKYYKKGDYYDFLDNYGYAEDSLYTQKLKNIKICIK